MTFQLCTNVFFSFDKFGDFVNFSHGNFMKLLSHRAMRCSKKARLKRAAEVARLIFSDNLSRHLYVVTPLSRAN